MRRSFFFFAVCFVAALAQAQDVPAADSTRTDSAPKPPTLIRPETPREDPAQSGQQPGPAVVVSAGPQLLLRDGRPANSLSPTPLQVTTYERHNQMRRERDEEFVVQLCRPYGKWKECPAWNWGSANGLVLVALEMKDVDGLIVRYREGDEYLAVAEGSPVRTAQGQEAFRLKVRAAKDFPLGATRLEGKLTFQRIVDEKLSAPETIAVSIPVMVVKHDTEVAESYWAIDPPKHHPLEGLGEVLLYIVAVPLALPFIIGCSINSGNCE